MVREAWGLSKEDVLDRLQSSQEEGLSRQEVDARLKDFGPNSIEARKKVSRWFLLLKQFNNPVVYVLFFAGLIAVFLGETLDSLAIFAIVTLNALIGFFQESKAEASIEALAAISAPRGRVLREGKILLVASEEICPGDILILEAGDYIVADARLLVTRQLACDEAILTGESLPVEKQTESISTQTALGDRSNMVFASTAISRGTGKAVVVATGRQTEIGKIAQMMENTESSETPLQRRLEGVSRRLLIAGIVVIGIVVILGWIQERPWSEVLMSALSLSIATIPEGLPTVVTIALVMAVKRMSHKHALVRKMDAVETLGTTDVICTDKTGTLTTGRMKVRELRASSSQEESLLETMVICNNASLEGEGSGDTTEIALLHFAHERGFTAPMMHQRFPRIFEWSFDSSRKRMSVAVEAPQGVVIHVKGAPEAMLSICQMDEAERVRAQQQVDELSSKGMRVLAFGKKQEPRQDFSHRALDTIESDLMFTGLVALADPPRPETMSAIRRCQQAGIRIIMITGDHPQTAISIGTELGIISPGEKALTGGELDKLLPHQLPEATEKISIYARVSPENKLQLVSALKKKGHTVAMTGDGVNDAPALKSADIGVSMGKGGTEVARQASALVLTDDNFATIVDAVEEGRAVNGNIKRTLQYLLSTNLAELLFILVSTILGWPVPLLPIHLLWVNLVTDGLPSLALAAERVPAEYLQHSQRPSAESFFDKIFYEEMILIGVLITLMCLGVYHVGLKTEDVTTARSLAFCFIVYVILFRSFSCRSDVLTFFEMKSDRNLILAVLVPILFQLAIQQSDFLLGVFKMKSLSLSTNLVLLGLALIPVSTIELYKFWRRKR